MDFGVEPSEGSSLANVGGYFLLEAAPGDRVEQSIVVSNSSSKPLNLQLAAVDAITGPIGGASYRLPSEKIRETGAWIKLEKQEMQLGPHESRTVSFEVAVPTDATSGEHLAGLSVWPKGEADDDKEAAVGVIVRSRRIIAIQVDTPGPSGAELQIAGVKPVARPDGIYLEIAVKNAGFGLTTGHGSIALPEDGFHREFDVATFVAQTAIEFPVKWAEDPETGEYRAEVEIEYAAGKIARWEGTFVVGDPVLQELEDRGGATAGGMPWLWILALGTLLLGGVLAVWLRRRRSSYAPTRAPATRPVVQPPPPPLRTAPSPIVAARRASTGPSRRQPPPPPPPPRPGRFLTPRPAPPIGTP